MTQWFYERNTELLESSVNRTFEEILWMSKDEFRQWVIDLRKTIVDLWDNKNLPPRVGFDKQGIIDQFNQMESFSVRDFECIDELTGEKDVIRNTSVIGNAVNQWFPTMMKTRINYTKKDDGKSIYDYFAKEELLETFITYASRHFKRDSFYHYSHVTKANDKSYYGHLPVTPDGVSWVKEFEDKFRQRGEYDYWLQPKELDSEYTGYSEELRNTKYLTIHKDDIESLNIPEKCKTNVDYNKSEHYAIRPFKFGQKLFPIGLKAFRVSFCQYAVNFPPLTAKYLYERFTEHIKEQPTIRIYDPSSGWGGRLLGAMSVRDDRHIFYIGTDPNTDHNTSDGRTKYDEIADFYRQAVNKGGLWANEYSHTKTKIFQLGSEVIRNNEEFQKFRGKLDLVFTSPPYFAKEAYSEDPTQSYKKFGQYEEWCEGFLRPTLETAVEWLRNDRYLLWNIADAVFGGDMLPLEEDSRKILESLGMKYKGKLKMSLAQMPGGNRVDSETGLPKAKNFCKVKNEKGQDMWLKYEPVFIFYKP
jgi:hypothetical protein